MKDYRLVHCLVLMITLCAAVSSAQKCFFTNPISRRSTPDPWVIYRDGYYFFTATTGGNVAIHRSEKLQDVADAPEVVVWNTEVMPGF